MLYFYHNYMPMHAQKGLMKESAKVGDEDEWPYLNDMDYKRASLTRTVYEAW